jgi:hypothetical protein
MYSEGFFLIIGGAALLILITALILSILVFSTKSLVLEITAWVLGIIWLILDQAIVYSGMFDTEDVTNYFFYPILLIFFLLLQYRSNSAQGNNLKIFYIAKTVMILLFVGSVHSQIINMLAQQDLLNFAKTSGRLIIPAIGLLISISVMTYITNLYLQRINAVANKNDIFKSAIIFAAASFFFDAVLAHIFFFIRFYKHLTDLSGYSFFRPQQLAIQMGYLIIETLLAATIAAYIYKSKQEAGIPVQVKE